MSSSESASPVDLQALYLGHHRWLRNWLGKRLGCSETASDLAQDTFVKVLLSQQHEPIRIPRAYLSRIAHGLMVNHWRRKDIERACLAALENLPDAEVPSPETCESMLQVLYEIDAALEQLPGLVKQAFLLSQLDGMKYQEIAAQLDVAEITVKRYVKRGLVQCLMVMDSLS